MLFKKNFFFPENLKQITLFLLSTIFLASGPLFVTRYKYRNRLQFLPKTCLQHYSTYNNNPITTMMSPTLILQQQHSEPLFDQEFPNLTSFTTQILQQHNNLRSNSISGRFYRVPMTSLRIVELLKFRKFSILWKIFC